MKKMLLYLAVCQALFATAQPCSTIYVNAAATGASNGTSWQDAFTNLQDAITESANCVDAGVEIWVAQGTYRPDIGETQAAGNRYATFYLLDNVVLLGGFTGLETGSSERDWQTNETILSGDIGVAGDSTDNSFTVVTAIGNIETAVLDGFTIRDGNAGETGVPFEDPTRSGGGMHNSFGNPTIRNCIFRNNSAEYYGAGLYNEAGNIMVQNCSFLQNHAAFGGGGFYHTSGNAIYSTCTIAENRSNFGGGLYIAGGSPKLVNCTISGNDAGFGGGLRTSGNDADPVFINCLLSGNRAGFGGGVQHTGNSLTFYNCTIAGNKAGRGGGLQVHGINTFVNCILWDNAATVEGNQLLITSTGNVNLSYSCYTNGVNDIASDGIFSAAADCITSNPLFRSPLPWSPLATIGGDYRLRAISAAINAGDNTVAPGTTSDLDGNARVFEAVVDMGAYEYATATAPCPGVTRLYVNSAAAAGGNGSSWATAFRHLQDALDTGAGCDEVSEIWVARGLYLPDQGGGQTAGNRDAAFQLHNGLAIYGGFSGGETMLEQRNWQTFLTILSGDIGITDTPNDNSYTVAVSSSTDSTAILDGFIIRDGESDFPTPAYNYPRWSGGGIYNEGGSPAIRNCTIRNNRSQQAGGGMFNWRNSHPTLVDCIFTENFAPSNGSGMVNSENANPRLINCTFSNNDGSSLFNRESSPTLEGCRFLSNEGGFGPGVYNFSNSAPTFYHCIFSGNSGSFGGAVYNQASSPAFFNCLFSGNRASFGGAIHNLGIFNQTYTNCTFSGNRGSAGGGAIRNQGAGASVMTLNNCILWGNSGDGDGDQIQSDGAATIALFATCYANGPNDLDINGGFNPDADCLTENPLFVLPVLALAAPSTTGDYRLSPCSPVVNKGSNGLIPDGITIDLDEEARIVSNLVDMGAYEFRDTQNVQLPQISLEIVQPACSDIPSGSAIASVSSGAMPYTYLWSSGQVTPTLSGLAPGDYTLTVTDNSGCKASVGFSITAPEQIQSATENLKDALCGIEDGQASVTVSGGTPPYTYLWSGGQTDSLAIGLPGGIHTVSITDANGCVQTNTVDIGQSDAVEASITDVLLVSCLGNDGRLSAQAAGGTGTISYLWSNDETTETINGLAVGDYSVTLTDSLGCTAVVTTTLGAEAPFESQLVNIGNVSCNGLADGQATVAPVSGMAPFSYLWEDGQTMATAQNLAPGSHSVTITEGHGCTTTRSINITEPPVLEAAITGFTPVSCLSNNSGQATAMGIGGTGLYDYLWSDGQETAQATGLEAGVYTIEITDANGCMATNAVTILGPQLPQAMISGTQNASACLGNDGTASVQVSGGQPPYTYLWSNGQTLPTATGLSAGSYTVVATDAGGCTATASASITSPPEFESEITNLENAICTGINNGTATVSASGGTPPYTYLWDNGETTPTAAGLEPGQHAVAVTDASGCTTTEEITITAEVTIFTTVSIQAQNNCFGDADAAVLVTPANGAAPYEYLWSTGADTPGISDLPAGTYFLSITDANGCRAVAGAIITEPALLMLSANGANGLCGNTNSGSATAQASGGTAPYSYLWSDGQNTATALDLGPGTYTATVTDAHNCTATTIVNVTAPQPLAASIVNTLPASCVDEADGSASVQVSGGIMPYTYLWSNGQTSPTAGGLLPGNYTVIIADANNCTVEVPATISSAVPAVNANIVLDGTALSAIQGGAQYQWIDCNTALPVSGATAQTFQPEMSGNYAAIISIGNCSVQSTCINVTVTALEGEPAPGEAPVQVFPNPNSGRFSLILPEAAQVLFFNAAGAKLWQSHYPAGRHELDRQALPSGVYWLQAIRRTGVEAVKVVVE